jgi:uncharacterized protein with HEPN domain
MRSERMYLDDVVLYARRVVDKTRGITREQFVTDDTLQLAVVHMLQIIGEASSKLSDATRAQFPSVPWAQIVGMRHLIVHEYFRVDVDRIYITATKFVPELLNVVGLSIEPLLEDEETS